MTFNTSSGTNTTLVGQSLWTESDSPGAQTNYDNLRLYAEAAAAYWSGSASGNWTGANWSTTAGTNDAIVGSPDFQTNVHFYTTTPAAGNLSTTLNGNFDINSLTFDVTATSSVTIAGANTLKLEASASNGNTLGNGITVNTPSSGTATQTISANVSLGSSQTWTVNSGAALAVTGAISDSGSGYRLTKAGAGTLTLSGSNTYSGGLRHSPVRGTIPECRCEQHNLGGAASNLVFNGGALQITGTNLTNFSGIGHAVSFTSGQPVILDINNATNTFTVDQVLNQGAGGFTKNGAGTLVLNQSNTYTGATSINAGTLAVSGFQLRSNSEGGALHQQAAALDLPEP